MTPTSCTAAYFTGAGTTRTITERFVAAIEAAGIPVRAVDVTQAGSDVPAFGPDDLAVFAVPSYGKLRARSGARAVCALRGARYAGGSHRHLR